VSKVVVFAASVITCEQFISPLFISAPVLAAAEKACPRLMEIPLSADELIVLDPPVIVTLLKVALPSDLIDQPLA
jgi:hypothetical protein